MWLFTWSDYISSEVVGNGATSDSHSQPTKKDWKKSEKILKQQQQQQKLASLFLDSIKIFPVFS